MKRTPSPAQPAIDDGDEDEFHWEQGRGQRQRFECLKCDPRHGTTFYGFGDDLVWPHDAMDC